ncbi:hypothetical protein G4D82_00370 [Flavobacterium sp. CYK-4]|uniref:PD40 domain-containing protein n=1 Tax=Flavobacterium lotistagni TaxID=2709660 RepID=UPI001409D094|nr:PD40 domain-containing protein [Flavobacterium lotistagni]NHM05662.1 hypothetical protein [Flavobacterium lotistagni]
MKKYILCLWLFSLAANAQQIQWANKLIKYSSDLGGKQYGIKRILGQPDAFPQAGISPNAWTPKNALDGREIVEVSFEKPQSVKQVAVFENVNAGCVMRISLADESGKYQTVWSRQRDWKTPTFKASIPADRNYYYRRKRRKIQEAPELFNPGIENAILDQSYPNIVSVKVEFDFSLLPGQKQVDAIGISDSDVPLKAQVNTVAAFESISQPEELSLIDTDISAAVVDSDGKRLYFTSNDEQKDQVYCALRNPSGSWFAPKLQSVLSQNENYNFVEFATATQMLKGGNRYTTGTGETGFQLYKISGDDFQPAEPIRITAYSNYGETADATLTADLKTIVLAVESDFTQGGTDFYFANQKDDGSYGLLQNMGKAINSADDEVNPQLLSDTKTLLFASCGFSSLGNYDLFVSYRLDDTWKNWSAPINLGSKINSDSFESSPFYDERQELLYFTRSVAGKLRLHSVKVAAQDLMKH